MARIWFWGRRPTAAQIRTIIFLKKLRKRHREVGKALAEYNKIQQEFCEFIEGAINGRTKRLDFERVAQVLCGPAKDGNTVLGFVKWVFEPTDRLTKQWASKLARKLDPEKQLNIQ